MRPAQYAVNEYRQTHLDAGTAYADPHTLILMLYNGLEECMAITKGAMVRKSYAEKGRALGRAIDIISYLQACLNLSQGGELAANLDQLYTYMNGRLLLAGLHNDPDILDEVGSLVRSIKNGWEGIRESIRVTETPSITMAG